MKLCLLHFFLGIAWIIEQYNSMERNRVLLLITITIVLINLSRLFIGGNENLNSKTRKKMEQTDTIEIKS